MSNKVTTEDRMKKVLDNFNAMLDECKKEGITRVNIMVGEYEYSHPVDIKMKLKELRK
jgi:hypothetical protein